MDAEATPFALSTPQTPPPLRWLLRAVERATGLARLQRDHAAIDTALGDDAGAAAQWLDAAERWLDLTLDLPDGDLERVPANGAAIVAAEHPTGAMEGILLLALLRRRRPDVKVLANRWLQRIAALRDLVLPIDVYGPGNLGAVRAALRHLGDGGLLLAFPAGEVAWRRAGRRRAVEATWQEAFAALQRRAAAAVVPVHVAARNPGWFHLAGSVHRHLRTALLPRALLAQRGREVTIRVGHPIPARQLERFGDDDRARCDYLRLRTELLARRTGERRTALPAPSVQAPLEPRGDVRALAAEIDALPATMQLLDGNGLRVFCAPADAIPRTLREIGRLRELTFRGVGEGSGEAIDLDAFDASYRHLFVWDPAAREVVGAYRIGLSDELLARGGSKALYTSTFYDYADGFWERLSPALELGRSFVQPAYQKGFAPLLLLWRGIGAFVAKHPRYRRLFGTVSISADHQPTSVRLMVDHLQTHCLATELAPFVRALRPWRAPRRERSGPRWAPQQIAELQDVSAMVRELEIDRAGVPVLLEQYLKLGARLLGINVDREFHTIDALVVVDLLAAPEHLQQRYLGADGAAALRAWHRPLASA